MGYDDPNMIRETAKAFTGRTIASLCIPCFESGSEEISEVILDLDGASQQAMLINTDLKIQLDNGDEWIFLCPHDALDCVAIVPRQLEGQYWNNDPDYKLNWARVPDRIGSVVHGPIAHIYELVPAPERPSHPSLVAGLTFTAENWTLIVMDMIDQPALFFIDSELKNPARVRWDYAYDFRPLST